MDVQTLYVITIIAVKAISPELYADKITNAPEIYNHSVVMDSLARCQMHAAAWAKQLNAEDPTRHFYGECIEIEETRNL